MKLCTFAPPMKRILIIYAMLVAACMMLFGLPASAEVVDSTVTVSLVTCSPGQETYELYGHTGLRVRGSVPRPYDVVFNYGVFDFSTSHFAWRFALGETDYMVLPVDFGLFMEEYRQRGSSVTEQVLNLQPYEADTLVRDLWANCLPQNRVYRYNFFTNNCTTKSRDMIETHVDGAVVYPVRRPRYTYRQMVHQYTRLHPWAQEGNDLLLGAEADTLIGQHEEMFLPEYLMRYADSAMICSVRGAFRPLVKETNELLAANVQAQQREADSLSSFSVSPRALGWIVVALSLLVNVWELRRRKLCWPVDALTLALQGIMGIVITFMVLFSTHPTVGSNWQVWVLNPLPLVFLWWVVQADRRMLRHQYHTVACVLLGIFLIGMPLLHQSFSALILPLTVAFLLRSIVHLILTRHGSLRNHKS